MSTSIKVSYGINSQVLIKATPAMTLKMVLDSVCSQAKIPGESNDYSLKWKNKELDLSLTVRFANLPQGANLNLVKIDNKKSAKIVVALQLPDGQRVQGEYNNKITLQELFESSTKTRVEDYGECLTISVLNRQYTGAQVLSNTSFQSIGINSGSVLAKAIVRSSTAPVLQELKKDILTKATQKLDSTILKNIYIQTDSGTKTNRLDNKGGIPPEFQEIKKEDIKKPVNTNLKPNSDTGCGINAETDLLDSAKVINPRKNIPSLSSNEFNIPDSFFNLTPAEAKKLIDEQASKSKNSDVGFISRAEREKQARTVLENKKKHFNKTNIQFKLDDGTRIQKMFDSSEKAPVLFNFIKESLIVDPDEVKLYTLHPTIHIERSEIRTLFEMNFYPSVLINVGSTKRKLGNAVLSTKLMSKQSEEPVVGAVMSEDGGSQTQTSGSNSGVFSMGSQSLKSSDTTSDKKESKAGQSNPKWLQSVSKHLFRK